MQINRKCSREWICLFQIVDSIHWLTLGDGINGISEVRVSTFGPWSVSAIYRHGVHIGYGGNCGRHHNIWQPHLQCKRSFTFAGMSPDETRQIAKKWLLMGHSIPNDSDSRRRHLHQIKRRHIPLVPEHVLDTEAASIEWNKKDIFI